jgi:hypothetical protein
MRPAVTFALAATLLSAAAGCGQAESAPPVASVALTVSRSSVPLGGVIDLTYRFQVADGAGIPGDYRVFVHLTRDDGTTIWHDDHELPADHPTSRWQPGQIIEYTRTRFIPTFSYLGTATFRVGLYRDDDRLPLTGGDPEDRDNSYKVATIDLLPRSENIRVIQLDGWHQQEYSPTDPTLEWRWTRKVATLSVENPRTDLTFFLEYDTRNDLFGANPQSVTVYCGDTLLSTFKAASTASEPALERILVTAAQLGTGAMAEFRIEVDRTFVPATQPSGGTDDRELGIRVLRAHLERRTP